MLDTIEHALLKSDAIMIIGDLNYDYQTELPTNHVHYIESLFDVKQLVETPTRVTPTSSSLIDIILSSIPENHLCTKVIPVTLSDHYLIFTSVQTSKKEVNNHRTVRFRSYKTFDTSRFLSDLKEELDAMPLCESDINQSWIMFKELFLRICDAHAPFKTMRLKSRYSPWFTPELVDLMYERDHVHKIAVRSKSKKDWEQYKKCRNNVTSLLRKQKQKYFEDEFDLAANKPAKLWKKINMLTGKQHQDPPTKDITAQQFNDYFANIGQQTNSGANTKHDVKWRNPPCVHKFEFVVLRSADVLKSINALRNESSNDALGFDTKLLKMSAHIVAPVLTKLFNMSLSQGTVPSDWKYAKVTPIYKGKGEKDFEGNYRPISVIGHIAKIMEKQVQKQLLSYLILNDLITVDQSAYRPHHNTQTALHRVIDTWIDGICDGLITGVCFLDIQKCFDSIDHELLKSKLHHYGIQNNELLWFSDYLSNRSQVVSYGEKVSDINYLDIGVPQGSVLGPILFTVFINDITQNVANGVCNLYADDTVVFYQGHTCEEVNSALQECIINLSEWYKDNNLTLNAAKSEVMLISSQRKYIADSLCVYLDGQLLNNVTCANYLGMKIDKHLNWNMYINKLCGNISVKLKQLRRLCGLISKELMIKIYNSTIQPCIDYAISVWGQTSEHNLSKIQRLQNFTARIIMHNFDFVNCRGLDIVKSLKWMNIKQRCRYFTTLLMFKCIHGLCPNYLSDNVTMQFDVSGLTTRSHPMTVYVPRPNCDFSKRTFAFCGAICWNALPDNFKDISNLHAFKSALKPYILANDFT